MKENDEVYCIKSNEATTKGNIYKILNIRDDNSITISINYNVDFTSRNYFISEQIDKWNKFSDHFITIKESRKLKIQRINGNL